jgi:hypothetical protein
MNEIPKLTNRQYRLLFALITLAIFCFATGLLFLIPEKYYSYYALFAPIIFLVDVLILPLLKKQRMSEDEQRAYPIFIFMGLALIMASLILLYINRQPDYWIYSFVLASSFLTSAVVFQYLRNRKTIP